MVEQVKEYTSQAIVFELKPLNNVSNEYYSIEDFTINYYLVVNDIADLSNTLTSVSGVGKYLVEIILGGNAYFFDREYDDAYLTITKAATSINVEDVTVKYDGLAHSFSILDGEISIIGVTSKTTVVGVFTDLEGIGSVYYYDYTSGNKIDTPIADSTVLEVYYYDTTIRKYVLITAADNGAFISAGSYDYRIVFKGDANFDAVSVVAKLTIETATFEGIVFENANYNYNGVDTKYSITIDDSEGSALKTYLDMGAVLTYTYESEDRIYGAEGYAKFEFNAVGTYSLMAKLTLENYAPAVYLADLVIDKTAMTGILPDTSAAASTFIYNGQYHFACFTGFDLDASGKMKVVYDTADSTGTRIKTVYYHGTPVAVNYGEGSFGLDVGLYNQGTITFTSADFADVVIETEFDIVKMKVTTVSFDDLEKYISKINANTDITNLSGTFTDAYGQKSICTFEYYDESGKKVALSSNGTLAAGKYTIKIVFPDGNYESGQTATITISNASSSSSGTTPLDGDSTDESGNGIMAIIMDNILYIAIGGGALVVVIIIAAVVASSKKKKKRKNRKNRRGGGGSGKPTNRPRPSESRPVDRAAKPAKVTKATKDISSKDKATF